MAGRDVSCGDPWNYEALVNIESSIPLESE